MKTYWAGILFMVLGVAVEDNVLGPVLIIAGVAWCGGCLVGALEAKRGA